MKKNKRIALTGFMGVGKSSVARHLSYMRRCGRIDLDNEIERSTGQTIAELIGSRGEAAFREIETANLERVLLESDTSILSLGGGAWTIEQNRIMIRENGLTSIWLESTFDHCWRNIRASKKDRPLARNKREASRLFEERQKLYCLADWHFIIKPEFTSYDVARRIAEEIFS